MKCLISVILVSFSLAWPSRPASAVEVAPDVSGPGNGGRMELVGDDDTPAVVQMIPPESLPRSNETNQGGQSGELNPPCRRNLFGRSAFLEHLRKIVQRLDALTHRSFGGRRTG